MFTNRILRVILIAIVVLLVVNINPSSAEKLSLEPLPAPAVDPVDMGSAFTYQGRLMEGSNPANGVYDFIFRLYDDAMVTPPIPIGTVILDDYPVSNGVFMATLDFGMSAFTGYERWLEISVKPDAIPGYTPLLPRQQINPAPYATFARTIYRKTVVVKPVSPTGSFTDNGKELEGALNDITDASASNPYLLKIEPGIYDLFEDSLVMKPYVDVEGSGEGVTIIRANGFPFTGLQSEKGTVVGASNVEIRSLTIESDGHPDISTWYGFAVGVYVPDVVEFKLTHVTVSAYDANSNSYGIYNFGRYYPTPEGGYYLPADLTLDSVSVSAGFDVSLGGWHVDTEGIYNANGSLLTMTNTEVSAGDPEFAVGINNNGGYAYIYDSSIYVKGAAFINYTSIRNQEEAVLYMRDSRVIAGADDGQEASMLNGIHNTNAGLVQLFDSSVTVAGSKTNAAGIRGDGDSAGLFAMTNVKVDTFGENYLNIGIHYEDAPVVIRESHIYTHDGTQAIGLDFYDTGAPDHTISQTEILVEGATPSEEVDPNSNSNIGVRIYSEGLFKFIRDTIQVPGQFGSTPIGGVGLLNNGGGVIFENGNLNDSVMPAYVGMVHYYYGANTLTVNNSEIYTCSDPMCVSVFVFPTVPPGVSPSVLIGSTLLWGGPVVPPFTPPPSLVQCVLTYDETWTSFGPSCP